MAAITIVPQIIVNGNTIAVVKYAIAGTGDGADEVLFDASAMVASGIVNRLSKISFSLVGFSAILRWYATSSTDLISLPSDHPQEFDFSCWHDGIPNNAGAGKNGDIVITTVGLTSGDHGFITLEVRN